MAKNIFKPNKNNSGSAFSFNFGTDKKNRIKLYVSAILQAGWNDQTKSGSFKENAQSPDKKINVKFDEDEIGALVEAIETKTAWKGYHSSPAGNVQIFFTPYIPKDTNEVKGYYLNITKDGSSKFSVPISLPEARSLKVYLETGLSKFYLEDITNDINRIVNNYNKNNGNGNGNGGNNSAPAAMPQTTTPEPAADSNPFLDDSGTASGGEAEDNPFE